ncbi:Hint domain-containing protein [Acinetobacter tandoii]|uniref:Hint domain-containing protein n=1 Tax=Acinetobacter tandoii TaxID=202954 RepID=UPI0030174B39
MKYTSKKADDANKIITSSQLQSRVDSSMVDYAYTTDLTQRPNFCFAAGTFVHTDKGLVPIQDIKVGDMVLSMPEAGVGEKTYKPVLRTIHTPEKEVYRCTYWARDQYEEDEPEISYVLATAEHPIWSMSEERWCPAKGLNTGDKVFTLAVDKQFHFLYANKLYKTTDSVGKIYGHTSPPLQDFEDAVRIDTFFEINKDYIYGYNQIYRNKYKPALLNELDLKLVKELAGAADSTSLLCDVYNLEVAENHTYFVGEEGLWVHNCGGEETVELLSTSK